MKKKHLLLSFILLSFNFAKAQTWNGSLNTDWNTAANWSTNAVPIATGGVIIPGSLTNYPVLASNVTISSINMQAGSQLDFNGFSLTVTTTTNDFSYFTGAILNNSNGATDIVISITSQPGYNTYIRGVIVNDNITFNMGGPAAFYEADSGNSGNIFNGNVTVNVSGTNLVSFSNGDTSVYHGNLSINRTGAGTTDGFNSGGIVDGNFSFLNNTAGNSLFGNTTDKTLIGGTLDIDINDTTPDRFELLKISNQTGGGNINVQNTLGFEVRNDTINVSTINITGYRGNDFGYFYNNAITGNLEISDDITHTTGYHTYLRNNEITGNASFTINSNTNFYDADAGGSGNHYTGNVSFSCTGTGALSLSNGDTSLYDSNLTITRTGAGPTDAFNSGAIIGGNFSFTNNTAGNSLFGSVTYRTAIGGTLNITINDTLPGQFEMARLINQTAGGTISVQNSLGFDVRNDSVIVNNISITGYRGNDFGYFYNNMITGDVSIADDVTHTVGYHTYIRANEITGNASFTINSTTNIYEADAGGSGNHYTGDVTVTHAGTGAMYLASADTCFYDGNVTISRPGAGTTDAFNSGAVIGGNFSFTNNTAGSSLFGNATDRTIIAGTVNIAINDTVPGSFEMLKVINQTGGGQIEVQNSLGFNIQNDTLLLNSITIDGYRGNDFGSLYNNDITGDVSVASDVTNAGGYNTYIRANRITGNTIFTNNGSNTFYDADNGGGGNKYVGNVTYVKNGGPFSIANGDTTDISGNLTLNSSDLITLNNIKFNGSTNGAIEQLGVQPVIIDQLIMEKTAPGQLTLNDSVTVGMKATFNGGNILSSAPNFLKFPDNSTHTGASAQSHVVGTVVKIGNDAFSFPVGEASSLNAVAMTAPAAGAEFSAQYIKADPSLAGYDTSAHVASVQRVSGCEYWDIQRRTGTSNVTLTFDFGTPCFGITNPNTVNIMHWNGALWEDLGNGGSTGTTAGTITTSGPVSTFSPFTFGSLDVIANPLPLDLISFIALKKGNLVQLNWVTESELNTANFEVQVQKAGVFETFDKVDARNAGDRNDYVSWHRQPVKGLNYYRLKITDRDGRISYSQIAKINFAANATITVTPNPAQDFICVKDINVADRIKVSDLSGKVCILAGAVTENQRIDISKLSAGVYVVSVTGKNGHSNIQFIKR